MLASLIIARLLLAGATPRPATTAPAAEPLSVLAFNVQYDSPHPERSLDLIDTESADLVCLTEITPAFAAALQKRLGTRYPHHVVHTASGTWGVGLWSRVPLTDAAIVEQRPHRMPGAIATVRLRGKRVRVACVHLFPPGAQRNRASLVQAMGENAQLRKEQARSWTTRLGSGPALVMGDFNEGPDGEALRIFQSAGFVNGCPNCTPTFPGPSSPWPALVQIDHVLARGIHVSDGGTVRGGGSDHFAIRARVSVDP